MSIPNFDTLIPTTITALGEFSKPINLRVAFEYLPVLEDPTPSRLNSVKRNKKVNFPFVEEQGIISLRLKDSVRTEDEGHQFDSRYSWLSRGFKGNAPFSNSLALDASIPCDKMTKNISAKIFSGGKFLFNGFLNIDYAEEYAQDLLDLLIECGACEEDTILEWFSPQTINYKYQVPFHIKLPNLAKGLFDAGLIKNYDNLSPENKIEIIIESQIDKSHLKSKKPSVQRIKIHESGKILHHGPDFKELEKSYYSIIDLLYVLREGIEDKNKGPSLATLEKKILEVLTEGPLTSKEIQKQVGKFTKVDINAEIIQLIAANKINIVDADCYEKI